MAGPVSPGRVVYLLGAPLPKWPRPLRPTGEGDVCALVMYRGMTAGIAVPDRTVAGLSLPPVRSVDNASRVAGRCPVSVRAWYGGLLAVASTSAGIARVRVSEVHREKKVPLLQGPRKEHPRGI